ncbi:hypothetical protein L226DRAFT_540971 [Lentinus tigrinus ALCF2SS1-7]|uniref:uncharacterized protein n=1 Tax=Lentinus tigrinus ALCF2SS1-7 TaxID=1328758 RepID=UPI001165FF8F|nr:hypothetical protein L226DRAFT_540949 [Lentinus tigrinus ALCF2SS1-7]RPD68187.1 hypothetical protein L226DRAFT_540971 [Lentinus tigrinus ALCF2SS1-7]
MSNRGICSLRGRTAEVIILRHLAGLRVSRDFDRPRRPPLPALCRRVEAQSSGLQSAVRIRGWGLCAI